MKASSSELVIARESYKKVDLVSYKKVDLVSNVSIEMRESIISLAGERGWCDTRQQWLEVAARKAGISYRSAKSLFYAEMPDPKASIVMRVRAAIEKKQAVKEGQAKNDLTKAAQSGDSRARMYLNDVLAGKLSAHKACIEMGWRKPAVTVPPKRLPTRLAKRRPRSKPLCAHGAATCGLSVLDMISP